MQVVDNLVVGCSPLNTVLLTCTGLQTVLRKCVVSSFGSLRLMESPAVSVTAGHS